jgi:hypothetical protein
MSGRRNLTIQMDAELIRKARILAAQRETSVSGLVASELERLIGEEEAYEAARRSALDFLERGFHLGGKRVRRDELHER